MGAKRTVRELGRRRAARRPRLRILIVSEGAKTEGLYLSLFARALRASNVSVDIMGRECGSDPLTVVEFARDRFQEDKGYDLCYCVIDRDNHDLNRFNAATALAKAVDGKYKSRYFTAIVSDPCIEFWFILHFVYFRSPFVNEGSKSRADCALTELKKHMPDYSKSNKGQFEKIIPKTETAIINSKKAWQDAENTNESNPSTSMHNMIERILLETK